jgi:hypothetical protein
MSLQIDLMGVGVPAEEALLVGVSTYTTVTAAGTTAGTATTLTVSNANVTAAAGATGVILNTASVLEKQYWVTNNSASTATALVYPVSGGKINGLATDAGFAVGVGQTCVFIRHSTNVWSAIPSSLAGGVDPVGGQTVSPRTIAIGGLVPAVSTDFTNSTPVITEVYYGEILVPANMTVTGIAVFNGSDVTGNVKFGLYDSAGTLVAQTATTAGSGPDAYQLVPFTATYAAKGPATYFIAGSYSSATARYNSPPLGAFATGKSTAQTFGTLPTTMTPPTTFTANLSNVASLY